MEAKPMSEERWQQIEADTEGHTDGPFRFEVRPHNHHVELCGGIPKFDLTVMQFTRWGMGGGQPYLRGKTKDGKHCLIFKLSERPDWTTHAEGREHHVEWFRLIKHPDAQLLEAAPELLTEVRRLRAQLAEFHALADSASDDDDDIEAWEVVEQLEKIAKKHKEAT